jgi:hypothetical protein
MKANIYFDHYRRSKENDGSFVKLGEVGAAVLYKASDDRSGAPVVLTLVPVDQIAETRRADFEQQAQAALLLDHVNVARTVAFGREGADYAFISEFPRGETLKAWVDQNGPMSPDAVLRVALQVVSALGAASFHGVVHHGISPANIVIVSGQTAEGGWPAIKLLNFPVAGRTRGEEAAEAAEFASPEQLGTDAVDFRSEIYSLGGTMCYLLTGSFYTAEPRSLQTKRFAKPLRRLITPMLRQNPGDRPQDPMLVAHELRAGLQRVERRQSLARRFGVPFVPVKARRVRLPKVRRPKSILAAAIERPLPVEPEPIAIPMERPRRLWPRRALAIAAILLAAATVAAMLLPAPVSLILHRNRDVATMGVPVGVAQTSSSLPRSAMQNGTPPASAIAAPATATPNELTSAAANPPPNSPAVVAASPAQSGPAPAEVALAKPTISPPSPSKAALPPAGPSESTAASPTEVAENAASSADKVAPGSSREEPVAPAEGSSTASAQAAVPKLPPHAASASEAASSGYTAQDPTNKNDANEEETSGASSPRSVNRGKSPITASRRRSVTQIRRALPVEAPNEERRPGRHGSIRAEFAGMTPEGGIVLRLPNGQTTIVPPPPDEYIPAQHHPRRTRRVLIERGAVVAPPPPSAPVFPPDA